MEKFYRYEDTLYSYGDDEYGFYSRLKVELREYPVIKHTLKGVWLDLGFGMKRFVLIKARKRWALPTIEEAKISFLARKKAQLRILMGQIEHCEEAIEIMKNRKDERRKMNRI